MEPIVKIVELDGRELVKDISDDMEAMLGRKMKSVKVTDETFFFAVQCCEDFLLGYCL